MEYKNGTDFLNKLYKDMHMSDAVMHTKEKGDTPVEKIDRYLNRLEKVHDIAKTNEHKMDLLKRFYYDKYVIKELPEGYVKLQQRIARERGYGYIDVTDSQKLEMLSQIQKEQKSSLDLWIDYLCSDDALYPMWFKNYAFQGMIKLGKYDKENGSFKKRSSTTTEPFLDLNREVLAKIYDTLSKEIGEKELTEEETKALENGESFSKMYIYYLTKQEKYSPNEVTDGVWIKYVQGSDSTKLCDSLQGKNTGWCTAGYETAKGLNNLQSIGMDADFRSLEIAEGLESLQSIGGIADFGSLKIAKGLENLQSIGVTADFKSLKVAKGLNNLQTIGGDADFRSLEIAEGLESLQSISGNADFRSLKTTEGLNSLQIIEEGTNFSSLEIPKDLNNLQTIGWWSDFGSSENYNICKEIESDIKRRGSK